LQLITEVAAASEYVPAAVKTQAEALFAPEEGLNLPAGHATALLMATPGAELPPGQ
jgi:hypothetical protein